MSYIEFNSVYKYYNVGEQKITALQNMNFSIEKGEFVVIVGQSGAGKTTLLNILGGMDSFDEGKVFLDGVDISNLTEKEMTEYRRKDIGFVFQFYNLIQNLTTIENIELSKEIVKDSLDPLEVLDMIGLTHRKNNFPAQLSGGEQQRVSIGRAIVKKPKLLLCDEPTGALDYETGKKILRLLYNLCKQEDRTVIVITHNQAIVPMADRIIKVKNGKVVENYKNEKIIPIEDIEW